MNRDWELMINRTVRILNEALEQDQAAIKRLERTRKRAFAFVKDGA